MALSHRFLQAGEVRLHVAECGDPQKPLALFLHGFPECWIAWRRQLPALAEAGFHAVAADLRGYGDSDRPRGVQSYSVQKLAADIAALIPALGHERAHLIGHDWGGYVAWHVAMWHAQRIDKLAVLNIPHPARMLRGLRDPRQLRKSWYVFFFLLPLLPERALADRGFRRVKNLFRYTAARPDSYSEEDIAETLRGLQQPYALTAALNYYRAAALNLRSPRLEKITAPTLVLWGAKDRALGAELATPDPRWVPNARVEFLPDATHWVHADEPERVNERLVAFLRS